MPTKDQKTVRHFQALYSMAFGNRDLKFQYRTSGTGLFQIVARDHRSSAVIVDNIATRDMAELVAELLTAAAVGAKQLDLLVSG